MIPGRCRSSHNWHRSTTSHIGNVHASAFSLNPLRFMQCKRLERFFVCVRETVQGLRHLRLQLIAFSVVGTCVIAITKCITKTWRNSFLLEKVYNLKTYAMMRWCDDATNMQGQTTQNRWIVTLDRCSRCSVRRVKKCLPNDDWNWQLQSYNSMNTTEPKVLH